VAQLPGIDVPTLTRWLDAERPGLRQGELSGEVIAGGKSNLTYRITDGSSTWALRRPPLGHVLATAHDMAREYRVISALGPTDVPVPETVALCTDPDVMGATFYLMSFVDGVVLDKPGTLANLTPELAARSCTLLIDTLVRLHDVDPDSVGLHDFGRPEGFLVRQVKRWYQQWQANETERRDILPELLDRLTSTIPQQSRAGIVHGDYRLTNVMFGRDLDSIAAVVDWEMATLGDPLTDLGLLVVYQSLSADADFVMPRMSPDHGFLTADEMVARYDAHAGRDLADLDWYVAFGYFKLAVIAEGIHHRYVDGQTVGEGFAHFGPAVGGLLDTALLSLAAR
jgi:aminoglycoside phosphotransferase (APT) family kinase protein